MRKSMSTDRARRPKLTVHHRTAETLRSEPERRAQRDPRVRKMARSPVGAWERSRQDD
jgi:hypothetical protein